MRLEASWHAAATLLADHRDVLEARPGEGEAPRALIERRWAPYLLALEDATVEQLEAGAEVEWPVSAPSSFLALVSAVRAACSIPFAETGEAAPRPTKRFEKPRKHAQIEAFARVVTPLAAHAERVVDVGSGHGHLTRDLAERLGVPVIGLERDAELARKARALAAHGTASFAIVDVLAGGLALDRGDCVVGLHACGELGDMMVESAGLARASIALVGCCLQKRRSTSRASLASGDVSIDLPKSVLGLSNLTAREEGVEASRAENLRARERRLALHRLLREAGVDLQLGAEIEGLNRRAAHGSIDVLVARAFANRNLSPPSATAIDSAARWAAVHHARMRRLALPRSLLGRLLEVFVLLDRACHLEARAFDVSVGILFPASVSARNLVLVARPR